MAPPGIMVSYIVLELHAASQTSSQEHGVVQRFTVLLHKDALYEMLLVMALLARPAVVVWFME